MHLSPELRRKKAVENKIQELEKSLTNHSSDEDKIKRIEELREFAKTYGKKLCELCPISRESSLSITKLEESLMWGVKSIILHDLVTEDVFKCKPA